MTQPVSEDLVKAHHECGQVFVGWVGFGVAPVTVTIDRTPEFEGRCEWNDLLPRIADHAVAGEELVQARRVLRMVVAGEVAARKLAPDLGYWGKRGDAGWARRVATTIAHSVARPDDPRAFATVEECDEQVAIAKNDVEALLNQPENWATVTAVAKVLMVDRTLYQSRLTELLPSSPKGG